MSGSYSIFGGFSLLVEWNLLYLLAHERVYEPPHSKHREWGSTNQTIKCIGVWLYPCRHVSNFSDPKCRHPKRIMLVRYRITTFMRVVVYLFVSSFLTHLGPPNSLA